MNPPIDSEMKAHHDALLGQWRRTQELRDLATLRELAQSKGLDVIKSVSLTSETYKVFAGKGAARKLVLHDDLTAVGKFLDSFGQ